MCFFFSLQFLRCVQLFVTPWTTASQASPSFTISWSLLKVMSSESVMPSNHLVLCHLLLLPSNFSSIRVFSNESALHIGGSKYWGFSFNIFRNFNEYSGLISFRIDWLDPLAIQGTLKSLLQHTVQKHQFLNAQPSLWSIHESESYSVVSDSFQSHGLYNAWNSPGQNTGVDSLSLLQGIFPSQGLIHGY